MYRNLVKKIKQIENNEIKKNKYKII